MKKIIFTIAIFAAIGLTNGFSQEHSNHTKHQTEKATITKANFGVRGNCGMCKRTIEKAANSVEGVSKAQWSKEQKMIMVSFDSSKTTELAIQKAVAASGYDTENVKGKTEAYNKLPGCCKYDRSMKMNQKVASKKDGQI